MKKEIILILSLFVMLCSCGNESQERIQIIFDSDTNNELDDQHALAYLLFNSDVFDVQAVTVNATGNGGNIEEQYTEAKRVIQLCKSEGKFPLLKGADGSFDTTKDSLKSPEFDGSEAINFIISKALKYSKDEKLVVLAVGKLSNVALAIKKEPKIIEKIKLVWLGANYPEPGEYNLVNDISAMNYLLDSEIEFEIVTVRYNKDSGTDHVKAFKKDVLDNADLKGVGPQLENPVEGRHGGVFYNFGDYSYSLFEHCEFHGEEQYRALFDMAAVAVVKNPDWAKNKIIPAPIMINGKWIDQPENDREILLWEYFDRDAIIADFYKSMRQYKLID